MNYEMLTLSLWITLVGMAIVFSAIIILWIGMALLVKFTQESTKETQKTLAKQPADMATRRQAAAVAVAYGLTVRKKSGPAMQQFPEPPTALVSAWQAVMRANIFSKRGRVR